MDDIFLIPEVLPLPQFINKETIESKILNLKLGFDMDKIVEAELYLPEGIIQHIQSFLNGKEAAQTTLLSKSWYNAWLTRPNLDFDFIDFLGNYDFEHYEDRFCQFVEKTVERYDKLNLKIHSLKLHTYVYDCDDSMYSVFSKCIVKSLKMGATCLDFAIYNGYYEFDLPYEVFEYKNLIGLSLIGCTIGLGVDGKVGCGRLKSLNLKCVGVEGDIIRDIISSCPLIENLSLSPKYHGIRLGSVDGPFNKLKSLLLLGVGVDTLFSDDFSSKFPCLKDLSLENCYDYKEIKICSHSLECISFITDKMLRLEFDVPCIRKFTFSGVVIPWLSFKTTSSKWESNISISCRDSPNATWFLNLNKLLKELSPSKVSLSLETPFRKILDCLEDVKGLPKPEVENLTISWVNANCPFLLEGLLRCCRPIYVTQHWYQTSNYKIRNFDFMEFLYKSLVQHVGLECGLDQVDVEFFDEVVSAWRPRLVDASTSPGADEQRIRLYLIWRC